MRELFHKDGLGYFWVLNDDCQPAVMDRMLDAFAEAGVSAVTLHPRDGLRVPYGSSDWFELIRRTVQRCASAGVQVWLYDEEPFPSGAAGGRVFMEQPEFEARAIECFTYDPDAVPSGPDESQTHRVDDAGLFCFPTGTLLWCGLVNPETGETHSMNDRVGLVRQRWQVLDPWDSSHYYPDTPIYHHPRAMTMEPTYAVHVDAVPDGMKVVAFVARPTARDSAYGGMPDRFNPEATQRFLQLTHEQYRRAVGEFFGSTIRAVFTDEPKWSADRPWTPGLFESFETMFGYDLRLRLYDLFSTRHDARSQTTRIHYRQWCQKRFEQAWLTPIRDWCHAHELKLVGHISPEDDPVMQAMVVGNVMRCMTYFDLAGIDLIIPAVGDRRHPLINIGILAATGVAAQHDKPGVLSESLACSGVNAPVESSRRVLTWQTVMGMTSPVVHYAQNSTHGPRRIDAPPDSGPFSHRWPGMQELQASLKPLQHIVRNGRQIAPVAVLWPIRSFCAHNFDGQDDPTGMRRDLMAVLTSCLDRQVGVHLIDEPTAQAATIQDQKLCIGRAAYAHLVVPSSQVIGKGTVEQLAAFHDAGGSVRIAGQAPPYQQTDAGLAPLDLSGYPHTPPANAGDGLPRLIEIEGDGTDIRCTGWWFEGRLVRLLMNLRDAPVQRLAEGRRLALAPGQADVFDH